jgi:GT2 family glycosyltransferase
VESKGKIVVCLVGFGNIADFIRCLPALSAQTYAEFEVVICENGGPEAFAALSEVVPPRLQKGQAVTLIADHSNPGYAGGINRCIAARPGCEFYWVLNPDTVPRPGALAAMVADIRVRNLDATGGPIVLPSGRLRTCGGRWSRWLAFPIAIGMDLPADQCPTAAEVERRLDFISGASLLATHRLIEEAGLMREDYFLYGEEVEWCLRARARGLKLGFTRGGEVLHFQGTTTGSGHDLGEQGLLPIYCNERNRILILRDTEAAPVFAIGVLGALLLIVWRYGRRGLWQAMGVALSGLRDGIMNRRGKPAWLVR